MSHLRAVFQPFRRDPGLSALAVLTLALGLGATIAIFSVVNSVLLEQLSYRDPEQLIFVDHVAPALELPSMGISRKLYLHYQENSRSLEDIGLFDQYQATLTGSGPPERVGASNVTPSYFGVVGVMPRLGRLFVEADGEPQAPRVVVLTDALWQERFGADPGIVGRATRVDGEPHEIIGVLPAGADAPNAAQNDTKIYRNRRLDRTRLTLGQFSDAAVARLKDGLTIDDARADFERMLTDLAETFPEESSAPILERAEFAAKLDSLLDTLVGPIRQTLWLLLATVGVILLIACANVANLFLVRVEERSSELAIRGALGASRGKLIRQLIAESLTLAIAAGAIGLGIAILATGMVRRYGPDSLPRLHEISVNGRVALFGLGLSTLAGLLFGLLPALRGTAQELLSGLKDGSRSATTGRQRQLLRNILVAAQIALGLLLLIGSGLLVRTLIELRQANPGFSTESALSFRLTLPEIEYPDATRRVAFIERSLEKIRALPGVKGATVASGLPMARNNSGSGYAIEDHPPGPDQLPVVFFQSWVAHGYIKTMGTRLLEGRNLEARDVQQRTGNVVVNDTIAKRFWPNESALGKRITAGTPDEQWNTIVGVVESTHDFGLQRDPPPRVYLPLLGLEGDPRDIGGGLSFVVRASVPPDSLLAAVRSEIWSIDSNLPISSVRTLEQLLSASQAQMSFTVVILIIAAALALTLAAVGLYGVISYIVSKRTHEIGVRMALGAQRRDVTMMVLKGGLAVSLVGIFIGLTLALALTRKLESQLFGVGALDPLTFTVVPLLLLGVALLASYLPARRASKTAPVTALRYE